MHILLAHFVLNFKFLSTLLRVVQHWLLIFIVYLVLTVDQVYHTKRYINYCQLWSSHLCSNVVWRQQVQSTNGCTVMRMRNRSVAALSTMKFLIVVCIFLLPCSSDCQGKSILGIRACSYAIISLLLWVYFFSPAEIEDIRLADGTYGDYMGRVELLVNGTWGTVCNDDWSYPDARTACRYYRTVFSYRY